MSCAECLYNGNTGELSEKPVNLFHVSDNGDIERFVPRPPSSVYPIFSDSVVWAIDGKHLPNYLLPRDCPRVCFYPTPASLPEDVRRLIEPVGSSHVVAIESVWFERASCEAIWVYEMPTRGFEVLDAGAGYHVNRNAVAPVACRRVASPLTELVKSGVELRVVEDLWLLQESVVASTLQFSCIRMRNARSRETRVLPFANPVV